MPYNLLSPNLYLDRPVNTVYVPLRDYEYQEDIIYHLGTNLLGTGTYTNPSPVLVDITNTGALNVSGAFGQNRPYTNNGTVPPLIRNSVGGTLSHTVNYVFQSGFEVDLDSYSILNDIGGGGSVMSRVVVQGSNDGITWDTLDSRNSPASDFSFFGVNFKSGVYYNRIRFIFTSTSAGEGVKNIMLGGSLRNLVTGVAGYRTYNASVEELTDVDVLNKDTSNKIVRLKNAVWTAESRTPWAISNYVFSSGSADDQTISVVQAQNPTLFVYSPNGSNRIVTLPASPVVDSAVKIRNLDGAFSISIKRNPTDLSPIVLSNAAVKLQAEMVYDGTEWHVILT